MRRCAVELIRSFPQCGMRTAQSVRRYSAEPSETLRKTETSLARFPLLGRGLRADETFASWRMLGGAFALINIRLT